MPLTKTQKEILAVLKRDGPNVAPLSLGKSRKAIGMHETRLYRAYNEILDTMINNFEVFERRFNHDSEALGKLRKLARKIKPAEGLKV